jgi:hypothetical protein
MSKTYGNKTSKKLVQQLLSQWCCPIAYSSHYVDIVKTMCEDIHSEYSEHVLNSISNDIDSLFKKSPNPQDYCNHEDYIRDNLLSCFIKKYPHWAMSTDSKEEAMKTFISCEHKCAATNTRLRKSNREFTSGAVPSVILTAMRKISTILGEVPAISSLPLEFGKGASFSVKGRTSSYDHVTGALDITSKAMDMGIELLRSTPGWLSLHGVSPSDTTRIRDCMTVIPGSRLTFVPKTAKTDRPINIEPGLNKILQKGFGSHIRKRMKRNGIHLNRNPEKHQVLARQGSIDGSLATIDLSSASDMISYQIIMDLLPFDWFECLDNLRCESYLIEDKWYNFHKFSAMGNGYTFELESLIFYALAYACCKELGLSTENVSVFGDDIIIPSEANTLVIEVLEHCGFEVNKEKSFCSGPFRESCGGDYFDGISCRGFYVKDTLDLRTIVRFRNYLHRTGFQFYLPQTWRKVVRLTKKFESILLGPDDGTDDFIISNEVSSDRRHNVIVMKFSDRVLPKRWHSRRVWMLYEISRRVNTEEIQYDNPSERIHLSDTFNKINVILSDRNDLC